VYFDWCRPWSNIRYKTMASHLKKRKTKSHFSFTF
jgi:hypothetical protein